MNGNGAVVRGNNAEAGGDVPPAER